MQYWRGTHWDLPEQLELMFTMTFLLLLRAPILALGLGTVCDGVDVLAKCH
jgi:hypothetical protein